MTAIPPPGVPGLLSRRELTVLADCSTLLVQDDGAGLGEPGPAWFDALAENWINTVPGVSAYRRIGVSAWSASGPPALSRFPSPWTCAARPR
ncbi:hypothetical protein [Streptomyces endophyticus]|uniref:Uncharacterized protein n=1 Tax=Streptomyces endophyticus TaxID=714166 RepID=A0ABU6FII4_9ACTN|nr:hypothetical protein [Streptomyces endophyticus]MEB8342597.1 hypothetical protein [Streptomyces endophyticus]